MAMTGPWKVASALATCTAEKLVDISDPVCELPVIWSSHPAPADVCDCECAGGGHEFRSGVDLAGGGCPVRRGGHRGVGPLHQAGDRGRAG